MEISAWYESNLGKEWQNIDQTLLQDDTIILYIVLLLILFDPLVLLS